MEEKVEETVLQNSRVIVNFVARENKKYTGLM